MRYKRKRAEREATPCQRDNDMFVYGGGKDGEKNVSGGRVE